MNEFIEYKPTQPEDEILAILKSPQSSTSITKFAGPYIGSVILKNEIEDDETTA